MLWFWKKLMKLLNCSFRTLFTKRRGHYGPHPKWSSFFSSIKKKKKSYVLNELWKIFYLRDILLPKRAISSWINWKQQKVFQDTKICFRKNDLDVALWTDVLSLSFSNIITNVIVLSCLDLLLRVNFTILPPSSHAAPN